MMSMQARESLPPIKHPGHPLRTYPVDSPRAKARLVVLALLADGRVDAAELDGLAKYQAFDALGISREDFFQVLYDFCADVTGLPEGSGTYLMSPEDLDTLFAEVCGPGERQQLLRLMFDVIRSDGHLAASEARLFWRALDSWRLRLNDGIGYRPRAAAFRQRQQQHRTAFNPLWSPDWPQ
jgi:hypothetical protein